MPRLLLFAFALTFFAFALTFALPARAAPHPACQEEGPTGGGILLVAPANPAYRLRQPFHRHDPALRLHRRPVLCPPQRARRPDAPR